MAATIMTITKVNASGVKIQIKFNDGVSIPDTLNINSVESFRTWIFGDEHIIVLTNEGYRTFMTIPKSDIGWIVSTRRVNVKMDMFRINAPCSVSFADQVP